MNKILITGTSRGLGKDLAEYFLNQNWIVIGLSRSRSIAHKNYKHFDVDISKADQVKQAFQQIDVKLDVVINNASVFTNNEFTNTSTNDINDIIDTNVKGTIFVTQASIPYLHSGSKIIFINSVAGITNIAKQSIYCASKHAIKAFAEVIAQELQSSNISVTSLYPGGINTSLWNESNPYPGTNVNETLSTTDIINTVKYVLENLNIEIKSLNLFPKIEWH